MNVYALNDTSFSGKNKYITRKEALKRQRTLKQVAYNNARKAAKAEGKTSLEATIAAGQAVKNTRLHSVPPVTTQTIVEKVKTEEAKIVETVKKTSNKKDVRYIATATAAVLLSGSMYLYNKNKNKNNIK